MNTLTTFFDWLLHASFRASVLTLAVLLVQWVFKRQLAARARYALWLPVLVVLLTPVLPQSRWSLENIFQSSAKPVALPPAIQVAPATISGQMMENLTPLPEPVDWSKVRLTAWLSLAAGFLLFSGFSFFRALRRFQRSRLPLSDETTALITQLAREVGLREMPQVWSSRAVTSPAVTGVLRPVLLLPADFEHAFTPGEARLILQHELTHLKRHDLPLNALLCVLMALHWFNPLLWLAFYQARLDREAACDAQVLENAPPQRRAEYGHALLKAETAFTPLQFSLGFVGLFQRGVALRSRIQSIVSHHPPHPAMKLITLVSIGLLTFLGITRAEEPSNVIGKTEFRPGDSIRITNVQRAADFLTVTADYELASEPEATISLYITQTKGDGRSKTAATQSKKIQKGKGTVTLHHPAVIEGMPHVSFYPARGGKAFGGIYFGTQEEADRSRKMKLNYLTPETGNTPGAAARKDGLPIYRTLKDLPKQNEVCRYVLMLKHIPASDVARAIAKLVQLSPDGSIIPTASNSAVIITEHSQTIPSIVDAVQKLDVPKESVAASKGAETPIGPSLLETKLKSIRFPSVQFQNATLEEAIEFIRVKSRDLDTSTTDVTFKGVNIILKESAQKTTAKITLDLKDIPLGEALRYVTELSQTKFQVAPFTILITAIDEPVVKPVVATPAAAKKEFILPQVEFRDATLNEAIAFIRVKSRDIDSDKKGVNILVKPGGNDAKLSLSLKQVPVNEALRYIAQLANHQLTVEGSTFILTPAK